MKYGQPFISYYYHDSITNFFNLLQPLLNGSSFLHKYNKHYMIKVLSFLTIVFLLRAFPNYANAQNKFFSPKKYNEMEWSFGFSNLVAHAEGCTKGWA